MQITASLLGMQAQQTGKPSKEREDGMEKTARQNMPEGRKADAVTLSDEARQLQHEREATASSIAEAEEAIAQVFEDIKPIKVAFDGDREVRLYDQLTPEMISGEQPYSTAFGANGIFYRTEQYHERERTLISNAYALDRSLQTMQGLNEQVEKMVAKGDALAAGMTYGAAKAIEGSMIANLKYDLIGYEQSGVDLQYAHDFIFDYTEGRVNLMDLIQKYLSSK